MKPKIEHRLTSSEASFYFRHAKNESLKFIWHFHRGYELALVLKNSGRRFVGDNIANFYPFDLVLTGPGLPHTWFSEKKGEHFVIQFNEHFLGKDFFSLPEMQPIKIFLQKASRGIAFDKATARLIEKKMRLLEKATQAKRIILVLEILDLLASSKNYKILSTKQFSMHIHNSNGKRIDAVYNYINSRYLEPITLKQISNVAGMREQSFCRFFKNSTGKVFTEYLSELRIAHACMLLIETDKSIGEICFESGFNNLSNFNRRFIKIKGMPPRQYRQEFRMELSGK